MSGNDLPRVAALLPTWNSALFIENTLESLAAQHYANFEVIISDDASTDNTVEICERFIALHPRFRLIRQVRQHGWIGNANLLLQQAKAHFVFFAFHDDPLKPKYVTSLVEALQKNSRAVLAFSDVESGPTVKSYTLLDGVEDRVERARRLIHKEGLWWIPNRGLLRLEAGRQIGGMRRHFAGEYSADWPWLLGLSLLGEFVRVPEALITKVWRTEGLSTSWKGTPWQAVGVATSCAREIARAPITASERILLYRELALRQTGGLLSRLPEMR